MMADKKKKIPLGKPLVLTDAELDTLAQVTEEDVAEAKRFAEENAPLIARLLETEEVEE
jgi:hypothetical protein